MHAPGWLIDFTPITLGAFKPNIIEVVDSYLFHIIKVNKKNHRGGQRIQECGFLWTANNRLCEYGDRDSKVAIASRCWHVTLNAPVTSAELTEEQFRKMAKDYNCPEAQFEYSPMFQPTKMEPKFLDDGTLFKPCTLEGAVLYGLFLSAFNPAEDVPKYIPDLSLNRHTCPWANI